MSQLTQDQIDQISYYLDDGDYPDAELTAASFGDDIAGVSPATLIWLRGAAQVNAGSGTYSDFIRSYTQSEYQIRNGQTLTATQLQNVSNQIAQAVLGSIVGGGTFPTIDAIANDDAGQVASSFFGGDWAEKVGTHTTIER